MCCDYCDTEFTGVVCPLCGYNYAGLLATGEYCAVFTAAAPTAGEVTVTATP